MKRIKNKFVVRDENNSEYEVEEIEEVKTSDEEEATSEATALSNEEVDALKKLAAVADKLIGLIEIEQDEHANEPAAEMLDEDEDEDEDDDVEIEEEKEEIIDTNKSMKRRDSKTSVGAIEKSTRDSADSQEDDIAQAWTKRYGGTK